jgi:acyl-CoA hydrolase
MLKVISSEGRLKASLLAAGVLTNPARPETGECRISSEMWQRKSSDLRQKKNRFFSRTKFFD